MSFCGNICGGNDVDDANQQTDEQDQEEGLQLADMDELKSHQIQVANSIIKSKHPLYDIPITKVFPFLDDLKEYYQETCTWCSGGSDNQIPTEGSQDYLGAGNDPLEPLIDKDQEGRRAQTETKLGSTNLEDKLALSLKA